MSAQRVDDFPTILSVEDLNRVRAEHSEREVLELLYEFSRTKLIALLMEAVE